MSDWHVGQLAVCVDGREREEGQNTLCGMKQGGIYTIRAVEPEHIFAGGEFTAIWVEEIVRNTIYFGKLFLDCPYAHIRFRPVRKTSIEVFTAMLNDIPQKEDA